MMTSSTQNQPFLQNFIKHQPACQAWRSHGFWFRSIFPSLIVNVLVNYPEQNRINLVNHKNCSIYLCDRPEHVKLTPIPYYDVAF